MSYENPQEFFICLDDSHDANYDIMDSKDTRCSFCGKPGAIKYSTTIEVSLRKSNYGALMIHSVKRWPNSGKRENTGYIMKALGILLRKFGMVQGLVKCRGFYPPDAISVHVF